MNSISPFINLISKDLFRINQSLSWVIFRKKSCVLLLLKELNYTHTCDVALDVCIYYDQGLGFLCNLILLFCQCFGYTYHLWEANVFKNCIWSKTLSWNASADWKKIGSKMYYSCLSQTGLLLSIHNFSLQKAQQIYLEYVNSIWFTL